MINLYVEKQGFFIEQKLYFNNLLIVLIDKKGTIKYGDNILDRNIYAFDENGKKIWQINSAPIKQSPKPYVNLKIVGNRLFADNWVGIQLEINLDNGEVSPSQMGERPW